MVKNLSCVSCGSLKRFPHTFTKYSEIHRRLGRGRLGSLVRHHGRFSPRGDARHALFLTAILSGL